MKRLLAVTLLLLMLTSIAFAEMSRTDDATVFAEGIEKLRQINDPISVKDAEDRFANITSGYNNANYFKMYAQALEHLHNENYSDTLMCLEVLSESDSFIAMLKQYSLPSCESMMIYTRGRQAEKEGRYEEASELYSQADILDSVERRITLKKRQLELSYNEALRLFEAGDYTAAVDAFEALGDYLDSEEHAKQAAALVPTPSPTPTLTPTPSPMPTQTLEKQTGEITDSWEEIIAAIYDGTAEHRYAIGAWKELDIGIVGKINVQLAGFDLDERADGQGKAKTTWITKELYPALREMGSSDDGWYGWENSMLRQWLNVSVFQDIPDDIQKELKAVIKTQPEYDNMNTRKEKSTVDKIWIPSYDEIFGVHALYFDLFRDNNNNRTKKRRNDPCGWWLRSAFHKGYNDCILNDGSNSYVNGLAGHSVVIDGVAFGFCI